MSYDDWKLATPQGSEHDDHAAPCPVCTGDLDAEPCSEACEEDVTNAAVDRAIASAEEGA